MAMGRFLCQLCYTIVHYGERHPCFFYKDDEEVYTVPPPNEPEEMEGSPEEWKGIHTVNTNENGSNICSATQRNGKEEFNEANSLPIVSNDQIPPVGTSKRKRNPPSKFPSTFPRGMTTDSSVDDAEVVSVAGPSGSQPQSHRKGKEVKHVCGVCGNAFVYKSSLTVHSRTHTGEKPFVCLRCDQRLTHKHHLEDHLRTHTGEKPFVCDICGKRFAQKSTLTSHLRTHTGEKPYKCEFCGRGFVQLSVCKRHEKRKHGRREGLGRRRRIRSSLKQSKL